MSASHPKADIHAAKKRLSYIIPLCQLPVRLFDLVDIPSFA